MWRLHPHGYSQRLIGLRRSRACLSNASTAAYCNQSNYSSAFWRNGDVPRTTALRFSPFRQSARRSFSVSPDVIQRRNDPPQPAAFKSHISRTPKARITEWHANSEKSKHLIELILKQGPTAVVAAYPNVLAGAAKSLDDVLQSHVEHMISTDDVYGAYNLCDRLISIGVNIPRSSAEALILRLCQKHRKASEALRVLLATRLHSQKLYTKIAVSSLADLDIDTTKRVLALMHASGFPAGKSAVLYPARKRATKSNRKEIQRLWLEEIQPLVENLDVCFGPLHYIEKKVKQGDVNGAIQDTQHALELLRAHGLPDTYSASTPLPIEWTNLFVRLFADQGLLHEAEIVMRFAVSKAICAADGVVPDSSTFSIIMSGYARKAADSPIYWEESNRIAQEATATATPASAAPLLGLLEPLLLHYIDKGEWGRVEDLLAQPVIHSIVLEGSETTNKEALENILDRLRWQVVNKWADNHFPDSALSIIDTLCISPKHADGKSIVSLAPLSEPKKAIQSILLHRFESTKDVGRIVGLPARPERGIHIHQVLASSLAEGNWPLAEDIYNAAKREGEVMPRQVFAAQLHAHVNRQEVYKANAVAALMEKFNLPLSEEESELLSSIVQKDHRNLPKLKRSLQMLDTAKATKSKSFTIPKARQDGSAVGSSTLFKWNESGEKGVLRRAAIRRRSQRVIMKEKKLLSARNRNGSGRTAPYNSGEKLFHEHVVQRIEGQWETTQDRQHSNALHASLRDAPHPGLRRRRRLSASYSKPRRAREVSESSNALTLTTPEIAYPLNENSVVGSPLEPAHGNGEGRDLLLSGVADPQPQNVRKNLLKEVQQLSEKGLLKEAENLLWEQSTLNQVNVTNTPESNFRSLCWSSSHKCDGSEASILSRTQRLQQQKALNVLIGNRMARGQFQAVLPSVYKGFQHDLLSGENYAKILRLLLGFGRTAEISQMIQPIISKQWIPDKKSIGEVLLALAEDQGTKIMVPGLYEQVGKDILLSRSVNETPTEDEKHHESSGGHSRIQTRRHLRPVPRHVSEHDMDEWTALRPSLLALAKAGSFENMLEVFQAMEQRQNLMMASSRFLRDSELANAVLEALAGSGGHRKTWSWFRSMAEATPGTQAPRLITNTNELEASTYAQSAFPGMRSHIDEEVRSQRLSRTDGRYQPSRMDLEEQLEFAPKNNAEGANFALPRDENYSGDDGSQGRREVLDAGRPALQAAFETNWKDETEEEDHSEWSDEGVESMNQSAIFEENSDGEDYQSQGTWSDDDSDEEGNDQQLEDGDGHKAATRARRPYSITQQTFATMFQSFKTIPIHSQPHQPMLLWLLHRAWWTPQLTVRQREYHRMLGRNPTGSGRGETDATVEVIKGYMAPYFDQERISLYNWRQQAQLLNLPYERFIQAYFESALETNRFDKAKRAIALMKRNKQLSALDLTPMVNKQLELEQPGNAARLILQYWKQQNAERDAKKLRMRVLIRGPRVSREARDLVSFPSSQTLSQVIDALLPLGQLHMIDLLLGVATKKGIPIDENVLSDAYLFYSNRYGESMAAKRFSPLFNEFAEVKGREQKRSRRKERSIALKSKAQSNTRPKILSISQRRENRRKMGKQRKSNLARFKRQTLPSAGSHEEKDSTHLSETLAATLAVTSSRDIDVQSILETLGRHRDSRGNLRPRLSEDGGEVTQMLASQISAEVLVKGLLRNGQLAKAEEVVAWMEGVGYEPSEGLRNEQLKAYCRLGTIDKATGFWSRWSYLFSDEGDEDNVGGIVFDDETVLALANLLCPTPATNSQSKKVQELIISKIERDLKKSLNPIHQSRLFALLVNLYAAIGDATTAGEIYDRLKEKESQGTGILISSFARNGRLRSLCLPEIPPTEAERFVSTEIPYWTSETAENLMDAAMQRGMLSVACDIALDRAKLYQVDVNANALESLLCRAIESESSFDENMAKLQNYRNEDDYLSQFSLRSRHPNAIMAKLICDSLKQQRLGLSLEGAKGLVTALRHKKKAWEGKTTATALNPAFVRETELYIAELLVDVLSLPNTSHEVQAYILSSLKHLLTSPEALRYMLYTSFASSSWRPTGPVLNTLSKKLDVQTMSELSEAFANADCVEESCFLLERIWRRNSMPSDTALVAILQAILRQQKKDEAVDSSTPHTASAFSRQGFLNALALPSPSPSSLLSFSPSTSVSPLSMSRGPSPATPLQSTFLSSIFDQASLAEAHGSVIRPSRWSRRTPVLYPTDFAKRVVHLLAVRKSAEMDQISSTDCAPASHNPIGSETLLLAFRASCQLTLHDHAYFFDQHLDPETKRDTPEYYSSLCELLLSSGQFSQAFAVLETMVKKRNHLSFPLTATFFEPLLQSLLAKKRGDLALFLLEFMKDEANLDTSPLLYHQVAEACGQRHNTLKEKQMLVKSLKMLI